MCGIAGMPPTTSAAPSACTGAVSSSVVDSLAAAMPRAPAGGIARGERFFTGLVDDVPFIDGGMLARSHSITSEK